MATSIATFSPEANKLEVDKTFTLDYTLSSEEASTTNDGSMFIIELFQGRHVLIL